jgi:hypothetical protein
MHVQSPAGRPTDTTRCSSAAWPSSIFRRPARWSSREETSARGRSANRGGPDGELTGHRSLLRRFAAMLTACLDTFLYRRNVAVLPIRHDAPAPVPTPRLLPAPISTEAGPARVPPTISSRDATSSVSPIIQAQSELVGTMLRAMIIASGDRLDERAAPRGPTV